MKRLIMLGAMCLLLGGCAIHHATENIQRRSIGVSVGKFNHPFVPNSLTVASLNAECDAVQQAAQTVITLSSQLGVANEKLEQAILNMSNTSNELIPPKASPYR